MDDARQTTPVNANPGALLVVGDLLTQPVEAIVNAWNRNVLPWWLLLPQGVSGAIKKHAGTQPFRELARMGPIPLGQAVLTSAGRLPLKGIIHVAGINLLWRASERSIRDAVSSAVRLADQHRFASIAMPLIGSGSGSFKPDAARRLITDQLRLTPHRTHVTLVTYARQKQP